MSAAAYNNTNNNSNVPPSASEFYSFTPAALNAAVHCSVVVPLERGADALLGDNEALQKAGRLGKFTARNRALCVRVFMVGACALLLVLSALFVRSAVGITMIAARGISNRLAFGFVSPWATRDELAALFLNRSAHRVRVGKLLVENVVEPVSRIHDESEILLLRFGVEMQRSQRTFEQSRDSESLFPTAFDGYLQWFPFMGNVSANFTLSHALKLIERDVTAARDDTPDCVCFVEYGLPYHVVVLPAKKQTLLWPLVEETSHDVVNVSSSSLFETLVERFRQRAAHGATTREWNDVHAAAVVNTNASADAPAPPKKWTLRAKSGSVVFRDLASAPLARRRQVFGLPEFQCIENCADMFDYLCKPL